MLVRYARSLAAVCGMPVTQPVIARFLTFFNIFANYQLIFAHFFLIYFVSIFVFVVMLVIFNSIS